MAGGFDYSYLQAMKDTLVLYCKEYRYKNGAFAMAVTEATSTVDDLNIIINSPLLTTHERKAFEQVKNAVISVQNMEARGEKLNFLRILLETQEPTTAIEKVVSADMKLRGQYEPPPIMIQYPGENGTIKKTVLIGDDGEEKSYKGGRPGVVPGAPKAFNEAQQKAHGNLFRPKRKDDGDHDARGATQSEEVDTDSKQKTEEPSSNSNPEGTSVKPPPEKVKMGLRKSKKFPGFAGFGKGFEGNLRNAFVYGY